MNFKKFISGVSALAIAASAFAGMAVTANAAEEPINWKIVENVTDPDTGDVITTTPWSGDAIRGTSGDLVTAYASGSGNRTATYAFDSSQTYTAGVVSASYTVNLSSNNGVDQRSVCAIELMGSNKTIVKLGSTSWDNESIDAGKSPSYWTEYTVSAGEKSDIITVNSGKNYVIEISVNLDEHTVSYTVSGDGQSVTGTDVAIDESIANVNALKITAPRGGATVRLGAFTIDHVLSPVSSISVNYVDANNNAIADATVVNAASYSIGDTYSYSYPKYIANGGNLYKTTADKTRATVKLTEAAQNVNAVYSVEAEGTYYVFELDGGYTTRADYESNGSAATDNATVTVPVDGIYTVTANCYGSAANRTGNVKVGDTTLVDNTAISIYAPGTDLVATNVQLHANDVITVDVSDSRSGIDYVILQKTGELPTTATTASARTEAYARTEGDGVKAVASYFTATVGNDGATQVKVYVNNDETNAQTMALPTTAEGTNCVFGIILSSDTMSVEQLQAVPVNISFE